MFWLKIIELHQILDENFHNAADFDFFKSAFEPGFASGKINFRTQFIWQKIEKHQVLNQSYYKSLDFESNFMKHVGFCMKNLTKSHNYK